MDSSRVSWASRRLSSADPCKVVSVQEFGAFVEVWPGCEGLIHVSQLDVKRVLKVSDVLQVGDEVMAIATGYDKKGKLNLSRKEVLLKNSKKEA